MSIKIFPFKHRHYKDLQGMLESQGCPWIGAVSYKTLPKTGFIVYLGVQPISAGFLRRVEGGYGQLDTFVTNPHFGSIMRNEALNLIINALLDSAKDLDLLGLMAISEDKGIVSRANDRGFKVIPQILLGLKTK